MKIIDVSRPPKEIWLGRDGENNWRPIAFECASWLAKRPNGIITVWMEANGNKFPLSAAMDGTKAVWYPQQEELFLGGSRIEVSIQSGDDVGTSAIIDCHVDESLIGNGEHPAQEMPPWGVEVVADTKENADRAEAAVSHYPQIRDGYWWKWDAELADWKDTHEPSKGEKGDTGDSVVDATYDAQTGTLTLIPGMPNVRGYVMPEWYGAKGDGVTDDTVAIQAAVDSGKNIVFGYKKTYRCGTINVTKNIEIDCRLSEFICISETLFNCYGSVAASIADAYDYVANEQYVLPNSDNYTGFAFLRSPENAITMRDNYKSGFAAMFQNGVCNDCEPIGFGSVTVDKITPIVCAIRNVGNVQFNAVRDKNRAVLCTYGVDCEFIGFIVDGDYFSVVELNKCRRCRIADVRGFLTYSGSLVNYYAIHIVDSSYCVTENCDFKSDWWDAYDIGGNYFCYGNRVSRCKFHAGQGAVAYGEHSNAINSIVEGCEIDNMGIGAGGIVRNCTINENRVLKGLNETQCVVDFKPVNVEGINTFIVENLTLNYEPDSATLTRIGVFTKTNGYTAGNVFYVDGITIRHLSATSEASLTKLPSALGFSVNESIGTMVVNGDIILEDVIGSYGIHKSNTYPLMTFATGCKTTIINSRKRDSDGNSLLKVGGTGNPKFTPVVEIRDCLVNRIDGDFDTLLLFNVDSTTYILGSFSAIILRGDNVNRLMSNAAMLANFANAKVTNMRFNDNNFWAYLNIKDGIGNYGLLGNNGVVNTALS